MAKFRQVHTTFWQDGFVLDLTPEEKYFYVYLMTNSKSSQCGIYELPKRVIETETGYNRETVDKLLQRFIDYNKISYSDVTKEIMLKNWVKYNFINSPKVVKCIEKELQDVKEKRFIGEYLTIAKRLGYRIDTLSIDYGEEEQEEEEEEEEQEEEKTDVDVFGFYEQNFGLLSPKMVQTLEMWINDLNEELVVESLKRSLSKSYPIKYAEQIMRTWFREGVKTLDQVYELDKKHSNKTELEQPKGRDVSNNDVYDISAGENW